MEEEETVGPYGLHEARPRVSHPSHPVPRAEEGRKKILRVWNIKHFFFFFFFFSQDTPD